jgi:hypothetical protein
MRNNETTMKKDLPDWVTVAVRWDEWTGVEDLFDVSDEDRAAIEDGNLWTVGLVVTDRMTGDVAACWGVWTTEVVAGECVRFDDLDAGCVEVVADLLAELEHGRADRLRARAAVLLADASEMLVTAGRLEVAR